MIYIKIYYDVATGLNWSIIALIDRDWRGNLLFAFTARVDTSSFVQAEAQALRWAIELVHNIIWTMSVSKETARPAFKLNPKLIKPPLRTLATFWRNQL